MDITPYVTSAEAAHALGYTIQHVRRLVRERRLDGMKLGRDWLVLRSSVAAYLVRGEALEFTLNSTTEIGAGDEA